MLTKNELKQLIAEGKVKQAIQSLLDAARSLGDNGLLNEVTHQSARFEQAKRQEMLGTADPNDVRRQLANIHLALLEIIDRLPERPTQSGGSPNAPLSSPPVAGDPVPNPLPPGEPSRRSLWLGATALLAVVGIFAVMVLLQGKMGNAEPLGEMLFIVLLGILAGVAYFQLLPSHAEGDGKFFGMNLKFRGPVVAGVLLAAGSFVFLQARGEKGTFNVTVFAHEPAGRHKPFTEGKVVLHLRSKPDEAPLNEKGEADFKEISSEFEGKKAAVTLLHPQPYQSTHPDSLYLLERNGVIYLEVALQNTDRIFGRVYDARTSEPLDSVLVSVKDVAAHTDAEGWFEMEIPARWQEKFQRVAFSKKGYARQEIDSIPVHTKQEIQVQLSKK